MKILIIGGAGYVGSALTPVLLDHGYYVTVLDICWFGFVHLPENINIIKKDAFDCTEDDFKSYDICINLSGISNDPGAEYDPVRNFIYNAALPPYLALMAKRAGVRRYIYSSTCSVYGYTVDKLYDETSKISCNYPYGVSKFSSEQGVMHLQDDTFSTICLRKGTISGVAPRMRMDLIVNTMTLYAMTKNKIVVNNPSIWRPILALKDAVSAYLRALQADYSISGTFNIAYDNYTVGSVADIVKESVETLTDKQVSIDIQNVQDVRNYKVTSEKAKTTLGFHPRHSVYDIANELVSNWYLFEKDIDDDKYYNINICKKVFKNKLRIE